MKKPHPFGPVKIGPVVDHPRGADDDEPRRRPRSRRADGRVEVTGSSIKRLASEAALPVTTIKAEEFAQRGITTLADVMMALPQSASLGRPTPVPAPTSTCAAWA